MSKTIFTPSLLALIIGTFLTTPAFSDESVVKAQDAFDQLAALAGTWQGIPDASGLELPEDEPPPPSQVRHEFRVSANGTVIMETMNPGTDHEMINMYHLDGEDLVMTHYCAGGNQPTMKLDLAHSTVESLVFDFTGGTNLDPKTDGFIHDAKIQFKGDVVESRWGSYNGGKPAGEMAFMLERVESAE